MNDTHYDAKLLLATVFEVDVLSIPNDAGLNNYRRWDSLGHVRIILHLEEVLGRPIETSEILKVTNISNIQEILLNNK
jgi:acyl carrier protein